MKKFKKTKKGIVIVTTILLFTAFVGWTAFGTDFSDFPVLQLFITANPFATPQQETFPIVQIFEENGFSQNRIDNIQFAVLPNGGVTTLTDQAHIQAVWQA